MSDEQRLTSTTDSVEAVAAAAGVEVDSVRDIFGSPLASAPDEAAPGGAAVTAHRGEGEPVLPPQQPDDDTAAPDESDEATQTRRRTGTRLQRRVHKLLHDKHTAAGAQAAQAAEIAALRQRISELSGVPTVTAPPPAYAPPAAFTPPPSVEMTDPQPSLDEFSNYESYTVESAKWAARQVLREQADAHRTRQTVDEFARQQAEARQRAPDFDEVIASAADIPITAEASRLILASPIGARLQYELAANRELAIQFAQSDAIGQARIVGALESQLGGAPRRPAPRQSRPVTKAPDPISPVGTGAVSSTVDPDRMSFDQYKKWRASGGGR